MIYILSFYTWCPIETILKIAKFSKLTFHHKCHRKWGVLYQESQSNFLHFELLIDVLTKKLTELWYFQNLTYFLTSWPSYLTFDLKFYRSMRSTRLHILTKFSDDWLQTASCIAENVTISFKHEYRRLTLTSRCDVISYVINIKRLFWDDFWCQNEPI